MRTFGAFLGSALTRETFDEAQLAGFWVKAVTSYRDARVPGLSTAGAFQHAYTAALQASLTVLAALGLRVRSTAGHYTAFSALRKLELPDISVHARTFEEVRSTRHGSIYEPKRDEAEVTPRSAAVLTALEGMLPALKD